MTRRTLFIKFAISLALLSFFAFKIDLTELESTAHNIRPAAWAYAVFFMLLQLAALSARWTMLINTDSKSKQMTLANGFRITAVSYLANYILITTLGGIVAKIALTLSHGFSLMKSITAAIIDRAMTLLALLIMASIFMPLLWDVLHPDLIGASSFLVLLMLALLSAFVFLVLYKNRRRIIFSNRRITVCYKYLSRLFTNPAALGKIILLSLIGQVMYFAAVYVIMKSLGAEFSFFKFMAIIPVITLIASLPVGYGGWGIREGAFIYGLSLINLPLETALMGSVQIGLLTMLTATITGIPAFVDDETQDALKNWRKNRKTAPANVRS